MPSTRDEDDLPTLGPADAPDGDAAGLVARRRREGDRGGQAMPSSHTSGGPRALRLGARHGLDDSAVTATGGARAAAELAFALPRSVEIRNADDDEDEDLETKVRPNPADLLPGPRSAPAADSAPSFATPPSSSEIDSITLHVPPVFASREPPLPVPGEPPPSEASSSDVEPTLPGASRPGAIDIDRLAKIALAAGVAPASMLEGDSDNTTKKVSKPGRAGALLGGGVDTMTAQALPASDVPGAGAERAVPRVYEEDEAPQFQTAVMPNAPRVRSDGAVLAQGAVATTSAEVNTTRSASLPHSDSGLRIEHPVAPSGERASLGLPVSPAAPARTDVAMAHALTEHAFPIASPARPAAHPPQAEPQALARAPRYGLIVTVVAALSVTIPLGLFFVLRVASEEALPSVAVATRPTPDLVKRDDALRGKAAPPPPPTAPPSPPHRPSRPTRR